MSEVICEFVPKDRSFAVIRAGNVNIRFQKLGNGRIKDTNKWKPDAQVYDPAALFVPPVLFLEAYRMAAAILSPQAKKSIISFWIFAPSSSEPIFSSSIKEPRFSTSSMQISKSL